MVRREEPFLCVFGHKFTFDHLHWLPSLPEWLIDPLPFSLCVVVGGLMYRVERNKKHCGVIACCQSHWLMNVGV